MTPTSAVEESNTPSRKIEESPEGQSGESKILTIREDTGNFAHQQNSAVE